MLSLKSFLSTHSHANVILSPIEVKAMEISYSLEYG
jgi:hypothetical protein